MRYPMLVVGAVLMFALAVPIYWTPAHCCGHVYDEGMTLMKHFVFGHESCLVTSETSFVGLTGLLVFVVSIVFIIRGFGSNKPKPQESVEHEG